MSQIFAVLFPVFSLILVGYLYRRWVPVDLSSINRMNLEVFIPALLIDVLAQKDFDVLSYQWLALACFLATLLAGGFAWGVSKARGLSPAMFIPSMMFNNSGNMGLPLAVLAFGDGALAAAVILFIVSTILHSTVGILIMGGKVSWWRLLTMPFNVAMIIGLLISLNHWQLPEVVSLPIHMLGQIAIPMMLVSLGVRMIDVDIGRWKIGLLGALARPLIGVLAAVLVLLVIPLENAQKAQFLLFAALPPAVLNYMFAEKYKQQPAEVASMVVLGNALSVLMLSAMLVYLKAVGLM